MQLIGMALATLALGGTPLTDQCAIDDICFDRLDQLSTSALRQQTYASTYQFVESTKYGEFDAAMVQFDAPGLGQINGKPAPNVTQYSKVIVPTTARPSNGYPVVMFAHGWVGATAAPKFEFATKGLYQEMMQRYLAEGYLVVVAGFRGHGTVKGVAAGGFNYMQQFDNSSYLMPIFYAVDIVTGVQALPTLSALRPLNADRTKPLINRQQVHLVSHSQGGDAALTALAIMGNNPSLPIDIDAASLWASCIADRFTQANTYGPMAASVQAFMSGDGTHTGTAVGKDGSVNANFVFGYPADWIGTVNTSSADWTWQKDAYSKTVKQSLNERYTGMYRVVNDHFNDYQSATFTMGELPNGKATVSHDQRLYNDMISIGGFDQPQHITQAVAFNISDRDYYSIPLWNSDIASRINQLGGDASVYVYKGTNHSLKVSSHQWYSPKGTQLGVPIALERDVKLFSR